MRAKRFSISEREITPVNRPEIRAPGKAAAETAGKEGDGGTDPPSGWTIEALCKEGVAGADGEGDADSTTHIRCDRVATSFATV